MRQAVVQLLLYGLLAGFSPLALAGTIAVMQTGRIRTLGFGIGFVSGQLLMCSLCLAVGVAATGSSGRKHPELQATLEFLAAIALIVLAVRVRRRPIVREGPSDRMRAALERLGRVRLLTTVLAGLLLGIGGPKRLLLTAFAATAITIAGVTRAEEGALVIWYVALATAVVWVPVVFFVLLGERTVGLMERIQSELAQHQREVTTYVLLLLAAGLVLDAISIL